MTTVTLIGKPGCHLCDDARSVISGIIAGMPGVELEERSILDDKELHDRHWDEIPVVLIDGAMHTYWKVDAERLRSALSR